MKAEEVLNLYDSLWFDLPFFKTPHNSNESPQIQPQPSDSDSDSDSKLPFIPTVDSLDDSFSPPYTDSSGNDVVGDSGGDIFNLLLDADLRNKRKKKKLLIRKPRKHKSLSELEFEELKGFMDLGFVFSEEDRDSKLASIIPGLQKLGQKEEDTSAESAIRRPYLSETWEVMERKKKPLMKWKIPESIGDEVKMKDNLKWWAHAVASAVR